MIKLTHTIGNKYTVTANRRPGGITNYYTIGEEVTLIGFSDGRGKFVSKSGMEQVAEFSDVKSKGAIKLAEKILAAKYIVTDGDSDFSTGETIVLIEDDGTTMPRFRSESSGHTAWMHMSRIELKPKGEIKMKKLKVGKKAVVIGTDITNSRHSHTPSMAKVGDKVLVEEITGSEGKIVRGKFKGHTFSYAIEDLVRVDKKSEQVLGGHYIVVDPSCGFKKGDRVELTVLQKDGIPKIKRFSDGYSAFINFLRLQPIPKVEQAKAEPAKPKFEKGDIVRITGNTNNSRNKVGDIGVISSVVRPNDTFLVDVPGRTTGNGNWTRPSEVEHLGLKGELKK
jgi:hypothetical protein